MRKICGSVLLLNSKRVDSFQSIRDEEVSDLLKFISSNIRSPINHGEKIFSMTYGITARVAFGNKCKDQVQEELITAVREGAEATGSFEEHGELEVPLTMNNIKAVLLDIFTAESETSSSTVEWAMSEMLKTPRVMRKAQAEVRQAVIKETLRVHPPIPFCEIDGYGIPVKTEVIVNAWAIGRDFKYWTEAETFWPERFLDSSVDFRGTNFEFIPFGAGRRICPGITFGIPNIELPLAQLLYHFDWKLPNGMKQEGLDMTETFGVTVRKKEELHLIPTPYHPEPNA
ncbi:hypothetical protein Pyn_13806 [Prunus yedoensis var. nudiflora]|uniref:Cytochrome P450 71D10 n=1 Tax=Prunus yedoensis var. nudiflora TaxID=2094558 RepID=A0A315ASJ2_PRUYE|nr:hypothetical protein Pyn_13806 [Prunus yedoensis var. nudiflora]